MGLFHKLAGLEHHGRTAVRADDLVPSPNAAVFELTNPAGPATWTPGEIVEITWRLTGPVSGPLAVALVGPEGPGRVRMALLLAADVDPQSGKQTVEAPDVRAGTGYMLAVGNDAALLAFGPGVTVAAPA